MAIDVSKMTYENSVIIGAVKVNKPFVYHDASYECAAWWEDHESLVGVHPVYLSRSYHSPKHLTIHAAIKAKVVNDYFPALWGGVRISNKPYEPKHIGEERIIRKSIEVVEAIERTGNSPDSDIDWFIHPSWWQVFTDEALTELKEAHKRFPEFWDAWANLSPETFHARRDWKFDDEYRSKVGMIAHFGGLFEKWSRRIEKINWRFQYHKPGSSYNSDYNRDLFTKNTEWAKAIQFEVNT